MSAPVQCRVELTDVELLALASLADRFYGEASPHKVLKVASSVLRLALAHPETVERWVAAHIRYREAEGFGDDVPLLLSRIRERPEYKRHMAALPK